MFTRLSEAMADASDCPTNHCGGSTSAPSGAMIAPVEQHHQSKVDIQLAEIGQTANRLILSGRLDSTGAGLLDQTLPAAVLDIDRNIVADLSAVCFVG